MTYSDKSNRTSWGISLVVCMIAIICCATQVQAADVVHVPGDVGSLQTAISQVPDGGIIEIASGSVLSAPAGGWVIQNLNKSFAVRATPGGSATLTGSGTTEIIRFRNSSMAQGGPVVFTDLVFANGFTNATAIGSAVTVDYGEATFVDCVFQNNSGVPATTDSSGAVHVTSGLAYFEGCTWQSNTAKNAGAGLALQQSVAWLHGCQFLGNRVNLPNHRNTAAGGAIHVGDSDLFVANTRFDGNQAGYVGGAIFGIGTYTAPYVEPVTTMIVSNCTFSENQAIRDQSVSFSLPTEGGALHAENQSSASIFASRFFDNSADNGGAVNLFRAEIDVDTSVFLGNTAVATGGGRGFGAAIAAISNDGNDSTTEFGTINRASARLSVRDSYIVGLGSTAVSQDAGGIFVAGDNNRQYGQSGVEQMGTLADNRATATINGVLLNDLSVHHQTQAGKGAGFLFNLTDLDLDDTLVMNTMASGENGFGQGGGGAIINNTTAQIDNLVASLNSAEWAGAGLRGEGSEVTLDGCRFFANEVSPGEAESSSSSFGAAIFAGPDLSRGTNMTGAVQNSFFSDNVGLAVFDDDRNASGVPINDLRYNGNSFSEDHFGSLVYKDGITPTQDVSGLNGLVVTRPAAGVDTDKSTVANSSAANAPTFGLLRAVPPEIITETAAGDTTTSTTSYLGYAWTGGSASLDSTPLADPAGVQAITSGGSHTLSVDGSPTTVNVQEVGGPTVSFSATPSLVSEGGTSTLNWSTSSDGFLALSIDQGAGAASSPTGSVVVSPTETTTYRLFVLTERGGAVVPVTVTVGGAGAIFEDGFESSDTSAWSSAS